jgi:hypothetical protein
MSGAVRAMRRAWAIPFGWRICREEIFGKRWESIFPEVGRDDIYITTQFRIPCRLGLVWSPSRAFNLLGSRGRVYSAADGIISDPPKTDITIQRTESACWFNHTLCPVSAISRYSFLPHEFKTPGSRHWGLQKLQTPPARIALCRTG